MSKPAAADRIQAILDEETANQSSTVTKLIDALLKQNHLLVQLSASLRGWR